METFSEWLETELRVRERPPAYLASKADLSRGSLSTILSDLRNPGPDVCKRIAHALDIPEETVFRKAGLLSPKPEINEDAEEMLHLFNQLGENEQSLALKMLRAWVKNT